MITRMTRTFTLAAIFAFSALLWTSSASAQAASSNTSGVPQASIDKITNLLQASGFPYRTTSSPTVWVVHFTGSHLKDIKVILALGNDEDSDLVIFVTVTETRRMPTTADFRYKLLKMNHQFDQVKVGLDRDDDLSVRTDASLRVADVTYIKNVVNQIKNASDEIYGQVEGDLQP